MKKILIGIVLVVNGYAALSAQSVGLVLSGGGAKGIAHIGVIKALEENGIPIDYIAGTSIGAIVGSLYAIGYSPDEMIALIKSDNFNAWQTGKVDEKDMYYFKKNDPTPEFGRFKIDIRDSVKAKTYFLPVSLINPIQMNLGMLELFSQSSAAVGGDFNKLMIPFRCIASDVYNKEAIVLRNGDLSSAVRASMTFPFVFRPIELNGNLAYDGGIYNNFPVDVMLDDFNPDYTIGSVVAQNPIKPDEKNLISQIENMVMQKTDYTIDKNRGLVIRFKLTDVSLLDFNKVDKIYEIGYKKGLEYVKQIREHVKRNISPENIALKRIVFKSHKPDLVFKNVKVIGVSNSQEKYILSQIKRDEKGLISFNDLKKTYFRLLSDKKIAEILPQALYNKETNCFDLILNVRINENVTVGIGGLISSASSNQAYLGLQYQTLKFYSLDLNADAQIGNSYSAFHLSGRIEIPSVVPLYLKVIAGSSSKKYFESKRLFSNENVSAYLNQSESFGRVSLGTPYKTTGRSILSFSYGRLSDEYTQNIRSESTMNLSESVYHLSGLSLRTEKNTLNSIMYPSAGANVGLLLQGFSGTESVYINEMQQLNLTAKGHYIWGQMQFRIHRYFPLKNNFAIGTNFDAVASNKPLFNNYVSSIVQAPAFTPTPHSKIVFNESLRAMNYIAAGVIPLWANPRGFQIRSEVYGFLSYRPILSNAEKAPVFGKYFGKPAYFGELSLVYNFPFASVSIYGNHYSFPEKNWNWGINIGCLLYNPKFIE